LKKINKKLLLFAPSRRFKWASQVLPFIGKSFLVLFFKKELLPSACLPFSVSRSQRGLALSVLMGMDLWFRVFLRVCPSPTGE
jgi:hypothetical protein